MQPQPAIAIIRRLVRIAQLLQDEPHTCSMLAPLIGCSIKQIRRDLIVLQDAGVPIESKRLPGVAAEIEYRLAKRWSLHKWLWAYATADES